MRRYLFKWSLVLALLSLLAWMPLAAVSAQVYNATVNTGLLNVRSGPSADYAVVAQLPQSYPINLIGRNADATWVELTAANNIRGWVNARFVAPLININLLPITFSGIITPPVIIITPTPTPIPPVPLPNPIYGTATVNTAFLNLREGPAANFGIVAKLARGQAMNLIGRNADARWVQAQIPTGQVGWVSARYISANIAVSLLPLTSNTGITPGFQQPVPTGGQTGIVANAVNLNVRYGPSARFGVFTQISQGTGVSLIARNADGTWLLIQMANGSTGWVNSGFISTSYPIASLPVRN